MVTIKDVVRYSPAYKRGIKKGDTLVSVNGNPIRDVLDYRFYAADEKLTLVLSRDGREYTAAMTLGYGEDPGMEFSTYLMDEKKTCRNKCIFCFIDQNPKGMRDGVYFKDDDERLSFLQGNYVTLTNLDDEDISRIIKMRITPVNVSVHSMKPELRVMLTGNRFAGEKLAYLRTLAEGGTGLNLQFVLCRGINDGAELKYSLEEALKLPTLISASVVPAGLTRWREGLYPITPYDRDSAREVVKTVQSFYEKSRRDGECGRVFCSDEFYILAELPLPSCSYYGDFPQYENGVGMVSDLVETFKEALDGSECLGDGEIHIATGTAAYPFISGLVDDFLLCHPGKSVTVHRITNRFYGESVTVSGLLTGGDYISQLEGKVSGKLLISRSSLNADGSLFLDGITPKELEEKLGVRLVTVENDGYALCEELER